MDYLKFISRLIEYQVFDITKLVNPLPQNEYSLKDTFYSAERIKKIPKELIRNEEYILISLDVVSLFTNVPVNIILNCAYKQKLIRSTLQKNVLKKLILDIWQKTAFTFNNIIYKQSQTSRF